MKTVVVTNGGLTISQHFGRATHYAALTMEDGEIVKREMRDKLGHAHFVGQEETHHEPGELHGFSPGAQDRHVQIIEAIKDCQVLLARGMDWSTPKYGGSRYYPLF